MSGDMSSDSNINNDECAGRLKILVVGDEGCGKTSLNITHAYKKFPEVIYAFEDYEAEVELEDKSVLVTLSELPSQDHYSQLRTLSYEGTDVALMCFSTVNPESLTNIADKWLPELKKYLPDTPFVLVGTKSDLKCDEQIISDLESKSQEPVSNLEALAFREKIKAFDYVECSAKTFEGVPDVYRAAVEAVAEM